MQKNSLYSGLAEIGGSQQGLSYGDRIKRTFEMHKITFDPAWGRAVTSNLKRHFSVRDAKETVTDKDIREFKKWLLDKDGESPNLRYDFKSDEDYKDFMKEVISDRGEDDNSESDNSISNIKHTFKDNTMRSNSLETRTLAFSGLSLPNLDTQDFGVGNLIATIFISQYFSKLFHLVSYNDIGAHMAFESYYKDIEEPADRLAEKILANIKVADFRNEVFPKGSAIEYFERLKAYIDSCSFNILQMPEIHKSSLQSLIDDIINHIDQLLYRLKRMSPIEPQTSISDGNTETTSQPMTFSPMPPQQPQQMQ